MMWTLLSVALSVVALSTLVLVTRKQRRELAHLRHQVETATAMAVVLARGDPAPPPTKPRHLRLIRGGLVAALTGSAAWLTRRKVELGVGAAAAAVTLVAGVMLTPGPPGLPDSPPAVAPPPPAETATPDPEPRAATTATPPLPVKPPAPEPAAAPGPSPTPTPTPAVAAAVEPVCELVARSLPRVRLCLGDDHKSIVRHDLGTPVDTD
jgi:hypothetical protein